MVPQKHVCPSQKKKLLRHVEIFPKSSFHLTSNRLPMGSNACFKFTTKTILRYIKNADVFDCRVKYFVPDNGSLDCSIDLVGYQLASPSLVLQENFRSLKTCLPVQNESPFAASLMTPEDLNPFVLGLSDDFLTLE